MARKFFITDSMGRDKAIAVCTMSFPLAQLIWPFLVGYLGDWGRAEDCTVTIKMEQFPACALVSMEDIRTAIDLYIKNDLLDSYEVGGKKYIAIHPEKFFGYQTHIQPAKRISDGGTKIPGHPDHEHWYCLQYAAALAEQTAKGGDSKCVIMYGKKVTPPRSWSQFTGNQKSAKSGQKQAESIDSEDKTPPVNVGKFTDINVNDGKLILNPSLSLSLSNNNTSDSEAGADSLVSGETACDFEEISSQLEPDALMTGNQTGNDSDKEPGAATERENANSDFILTVDPEPKTVERSSRWEWLRVVDRELAPIADWFERLYQQHPRKVQPGPAWESVLSLVKGKQQTRKSARPIMGLAWLDKAKREEILRIHAAFTEHVWNHSEERFRPHLATWISDRGWESEPPTPPAQHPQGNTRNGSGSANGDPNAVVNMGIDDPVLPLQGEKVGLSLCRFEKHPSRKECILSDTLPIWRGRMIGTTGTGTSRRTDEPVPGWPCVDGFWYIPGPKGYDDDPLRADSKGNRVFSDGPEGGDRS